ncbi:MAG: TetR/AcrR family transcriptional regulator [Gammaproteobacteria bacterium]
MDSTADSSTGRVKQTGQPDSIQSASARAERRIEAIRQAATRVFLENGYAHTSVDKIVREAGGSKATIYKYFKNKRELFNAVIDRIVTHRSQTDIDIDDPNPENALLDFARRRVDVVFSPEHIALMRLVIAEGPNSPEVAEAYYEHGPAQSYRTLSRYFRIQNERGKLNIDDPDEAAYHFSALLMHRWYLRKLTGYTKVPSRKEMERNIQSTVKAFLKLYI